MKRPKVIKRNQLPTHLPVVGTMTWFLFLDHFHAPEWVWAVWGTIWTIGLAICIWVVCIQKQTELKELTSSSESDVKT